LLDRVAPATVVILSSADQGEDERMARRLRYRCRWALPTKSEQRIL
jgi:hypothetical protein